MTKKKVYICSPYAGNVEENVKDAVRYCREAFMQGYMPMASHLHYPQMLDDTNLYERKLGMDCGKAWIEMCDEVWVCGPVISEGMREEIEWAKYVGVPVIRKKDF